jgi:hypothetical protein
MLDQSARTLNTRWIEAAADPLALAIDELPPRAKAYLAARHGDPRLDREDLLEAEDATWAANVRSRVQRLVAAGLLDQAYQLLMGRRTKDCGSLLPEQETEVLELMGRLGEAAAVARAARQGRFYEFAKFSLNLARVLEKDQQATEAAAVLDEALAARVDDRTHLRLVVARLALARRSGNPTTPVPSLGTRRSSCSNASAPGGSAASAACCAISPPRSATAPSRSWYPRCPTSVSTRASTPNDSSTPCSPSTGTSRRRAASTRVWSAGS